MPKGTCTSTPAALFKKALNSEEVMLNVRFQNNTLGQQLKKFMIFLCGALTFKKLVQVL